MLRSECSWIGSCHGAVDGCLVLAFGFGGVSGMGAFGVIDCGWCESRCSFVVALICPRSGLVGWVV